MVASLPVGPVRVLDLACGTGDVSIEIMRQRPEARVFGGDLSLPMLIAGKPKIKDRFLDDVITLTALSAEELPYPDASFDAITIAFGIRNVARRDIALAEMARVTKPGGEVFILDFSLPLNPFVRALYGLYFHRVLPLLGGIVSGNLEAYRYLPKSVAGFPARHVFSEMMGKAGFKEVSHEDYTLGVATLYRGKR